jgi:hypothetical protein
MKFLPTHKELLKHTFVKEREAVLMVCLTIVMGRFDQMVNYCSNLLKYAL